MFSIYLADGPFNKNLQMTKLIKMIGQPMKQYLLRTVATR